MQAMATDFVSALADRGVSEANLSIGLVLLTVALVWVRYWRGAWPFDRG